MFTSKLQSILTKIAIYGLAILSVVYFAFAAVRFQTAYTSGFEYLELNGGWVLACGFLLGLGVMRPRVYSMAGSIWILGLAATVMASQLVFWSYGFLDVLTDKYAVTSFGDGFWVFTFIGLPAALCGWLTFAISLAAATSERDN